MHRLLIVSPHFPPTNAPDHQRVRMSLSFYREHGWDPMVLAVDAARVEAPQDPLLAETVPGDVPVQRTGAWPIRLTRLCGLGNVAYRAWFQLAAAGARLLAENRFDLVFFSTTQFLTTALGRRWRARFGVPFVIDIQDPWRTDYYERAGAPAPPGGWKYRFARWQAARLEERAWREAAGFMSVSSRYLRQLEARYSWFSTKPSAIIPFGASETDFAFARARPDLAPAFVREPGMLHLVSVGAVGPIMHDAVESLFAGLAVLRQRIPEQAGRLRFHFIGTSYAPANRAAPSVIPIATAAGVADLVREEPNRIGYFTAIRTMLAADALVVVGSNDPAYNPSKLSNCALAAKPTLIIGPMNSAFGEMARELGFEHFVSTPAGANDDTIGSFLQNMLASDFGHRDRIPAQRGLPPSHGAKTRTHQQCALFDHAIASAA